MTPLTLGGTSAQTPQTFPALLDLLESRPQPALIWCGAGEDSERVELSGRVLQNWTVKLIGLFSQETEISDGDAVLVDAAAHWKATAVLLAAGALGWKTTLTASQAPQNDDDARAAVASALEPALIITDQPGDWIGGGPLAHALGDAELAALSPGLLDASFEDATGHRLPAWALDISGEVRQHPDQLPAPLPPLPLAGAESAEAGPGSGEGTGIEAAAGLVVVGAPTELRFQDWGLAHWAGGTPAAGTGAAPGITPDAEVFARMLGIWSQSRPVVLFQGDPAAQPQAWEQMLRNEGIR